MKTERISRKQIRLTPESYRGWRRYFVTICCFQHKNLLCKTEIANSMAGLLRESAMRAGFVLHGWCIMPNHLHFLAEGQNETSDLVAFIRKFKQESGYTFRRRFDASLWQRSFYDHVLRPEDTLDAVAGYIWMNPVRKQLCAAPEEYPFSGSMTMSFSTRGRSTNNEWRPPWKQS